MTFGLFLDPPEANTAFAPGSLVGYHAQLDLNRGPIRVDQAGIDWGDAAITAFMAEQGRLGSSPVDYVIPNRTIVIPLAVFTDELSGVTYDQAKRMLSAKVGRIQIEGGVLKRSTDTGTFSPVYADIVDAALNFPDIWGETAEFETNVRLTLTALPDFYGTEIALDSVSSSSSGDFAGVLQKNGLPAVVVGDYPARTRIVITAGATSSPQRGIFGGFRSRYTPPQDSGSAGYRGAASLVLDSSDLYAGTILTTLPTVGLTGATGGTAGRRTFLQQNTWMPVVDIAVPMTPGSFWRDLSHVGTYRVLARVYTTTGDVPNGADPPPWLRLSWSVNKASFRTINPAVQVPGTLAFYIMDLGQVIIPQIPGQSSPVQWEASLQAYAPPTSTNKDMYLDRLWFVPLDETAWFPNAPAILTSDSSPLLSADDFNSLGAGVTLAGRVPTLGGSSWAFKQGTGLSGDGGAEVRRTATGDGAGNPGGGNIATVALSSGSTNVAVQSNVWFDGIPAGTPCFFQMGVIARSGATGYLVLCYTYSNGSASLNLMTQFSTSSVAVLGSTPVGDYSNQWITLSVQAFDTGQAFGQLYIPGSHTPLAVVVGSHTSLATGGSNASGQVGIMDHAPTGPSARYYDDFSARAGIADSVVGAGAASSVAELRSDGFYRDGIPMSRRAGDYPRLPVSGLEGRPVEMLLKTSRGDMNTLADGGFDPFTAQVIYRPCWLLGQ